MANYIEALLALKARGSRYVVNSGNAFLMWLLLGMRVCSFWVAKLLGKRNVEVYGDSHADVLNYLRLLGVWMNICSVRGATAFGVANPNSKTNAANIFKYFLEGLHHKRDLVYLMGEVDCGFLIWLLFKKREVSVRYLLNEAISSYTSFISENSKFAGKVIVISTPLPTIKDGEVVGEVAKARNEVQAPPKKRTQLTLEFNREVKLFCEANGFDFVDLDESSLGLDGYVKDSLRNKNGRAHHYDQDAYLRLLAASLSPLLNNA